MLSKEILIETIKKLPDNFSIEDLFEKIILLEKIEKGNKQSISEETYTTEEAREKLNKYLG